MMRKWVVPVIVIFLLLLSGCGRDGQADQQLVQAGDQIRLANGDLQELTASVTDLPSFLNDKPEEIRQIYQLAAQHPDLLRWIPCYCGCAESAGHMSNADCFYKEIREDGSIVWDDHGTRCGTCLEIAFYSIQKKQQGMSTLEIRQWIDEQYKEGYAKPTPTPMPEA